MEVGRTIEYVFSFFKVNVYTVYGSRSVGLKRRCTLESPGEPLKLLLPWPHLRQITSEFLRVGPRHQ